MVRDETNRLVYEGQAPDTALAATSPQETTTALLQLKNYAVELRARIVTLGSGTMTSPISGCRCAHMPILQPAKVASRTRFTSTVPLAASKLCETVRSCAAASLF